MFGRKMSYHSKPRMIIEEKYIFYASLVILFVLNGRFIDKLHLQSYFEDVMVQNGIFWTIWEQT